VFPREQVSAGSGHGERQEEIFAFRRKNAQAKTLHALMRVTIQQNHKKDLDADFRRHDKPGYGLLDTSFRRKPESSAGEWQSNVCTEQLLMRYVCLPKGSGNLLESSFSLLSKMFSLANLAV
jgi:hypothetical protein